MEQLSKTESRPMVKTLSWTLNQFSQSFLWQAIVALGLVVCWTSVVASAGEPKVMRGETTKQPPSPPIGTVWYNGDWILGCDFGINFYGNGLGFHYNGFNTHVYDDFVVPSPGWHVRGVFCNSLFWSGYCQVIGATWEIRQGVSSGNGGMLVANGFTFSRSEEHTSELQSQFHLVCRLLLAKKNGRNPLVRRV